MKEWVLEAISLINEWDTWQLLMRDFRWSRRRDLKMHKW